MASPHPGQGKEMSHSISARSIDRSIDRSLNRQRVKTPRERYREAQVLRRELEPKARKQQGARTDLLPNLTRSPIKSTHVRDEIAGRLAVSSGQLYKIECIYRHQDLYPMVVQRLDEGRITVHKAYGLIKNKLRSTAVQAKSEPEKKPLRKKPTETRSTSLTIKEPAKIILNKESRTVQIQFTMKIPVRVGIKIDRSTCCVKREDRSSNSGRGRYRSIALVSACKGTNGRISAVLGILELASSTCYVLDGF